jgi:hypothetical protein
MLDSGPSASSTHRRRAWLDVVYAKLSSRHLSRGERLVLGVICLCTLVLLVALQHGRVFLGDEIGTLRYLKQTPTYILTHFRPWLTMNYFILFEKGVASLCGATDWRLTLLPIAAAIAVIPLTASLALKLTGSTRTAPSGPGTLRGSEARIQNFGQVEVTVYRGDTARALLQEWHEDLLRRTAGRIYPSFQGDYQLLALLEEHLTSGELADHSVNGLPASPSQDVG